MERRGKPRSDLILNKLKIKDMKIVFWFRYKFYSDEEICSNSN